MVEVYIGIRGKKPGRISLASHKIKQFALHLGLLSLKKVAGYKNWLRTFTNFVTKAEASDEKSFNYVPPSVYTFINECASYTSAITVLSRAKPIECDTQTTTEFDLPIIGNEEWLEESSLWDFRLWHVVLIFFSGFVSIIICVCCCVRFRIPRTKQEIEADYVRKKITNKFQKQLRLINNSDMDEMDLRKALDRVRAEFKNDTENIAQSDNYDETNNEVQGEAETRNNVADRKTSDLGVDIEDLIERRGEGISRKFSRAVGSFKIFTSRRRRSSTECSAEP